MKRTYSLNMDERTAMMVSSACREVYGREFIMGYPPEAMGHHAPVRLRRVADALDKVLPKDGDTQ